MAKAHFFLFVILSTLILTIKAEETRKDEIETSSTIRQQGEEDGPSQNATLMQDDDTKTGLVLVQNETKDTELLYLEGYFPNHEEMKDFGIIPYPKWNVDVVPLKVKCNSLVYWQTNSSKCRDIASCRGILERVFQKQMSEYRHLKDNFHILPDGSILEGLGWDNIYDDSYRVNLFSESPLAFPSNETLKALNYLVHIAVTYEKLSTNFTFEWPGHTSVSVDTEVQRWTKIKNLHFDQDHSLSRVSIQGLKVISRTDWKAMIPIREFERAKGQAEVVDLTITTSACIIPEACLRFVQDMQREQTPTHSDIFSNFIIGSDGRIYEGLGWNWSRKEKVVFFDILADCEACVPWTHALAAFTLQLREGVDLGWISKNYTIQVTSAFNETTKAKITKWGEWARDIVKQNVTVHIKTAGAHDSVITRIDTDKVSVIRGVTSLDHPVERIYFTQSDAECSKGADCLPFKKTLGGKCLRSQKEVTSNFYFVDNGADNQLVYEGFGWDLTTKENTVVMEFLTTDVNTLPSTTSMIQSIFLIREGLKKGIFTPDYRITVARHTSKDFENLVRFWDKKLRTTSIM